MGNSNAAPKTFREMQARAITVAERYKQKNARDGNLEWDASAYMAGFVGDVGDLSKLIMARSNFRNIDAVDTKIAHELSDCLWSVIILANELNVDLEHEFEDTMKLLKARTADGR